MRCPRMCLEVDNKKAPPSHGLSPCSQPENAGSRRVHTALHSSVPPTTTHDSSNYDVAESKATVAMRAASGAEAAGGGYAGRGACRLGGRVSGPSSCYVFVMTSTSLNLQDIAAIGSSSNVKPCKRKLPLLQILPEVILRPRVTS